MELLPLEKAFLDGLRAGESILLSSDAGSWRTIHIGGSDER